MCGFCGFNDKRSKKDKEKIIKSMADRIIHRGPDSDGYYVTANQNVTWDVTLTSSVSYEYTYKDFISKTSTSVKGGYTFDTIVASTGAISRVSGDVRLHAKTKAEQKFFVDIKRDIN